jgi:DMSO/TMAO reductase YedYZ heme-binding membrane subunit
MKAPEPYLIWREQHPDQSAGQPKALSKSAVTIWVRNCALLALVLIALPPLPMLLTPVWLLAMVTGYAACVLIAAVMLLPLRTLLLWPRQRISIPHHKQLAEWALGLSALHTVLFLVTDHVTLEYLKPSQPRYMLAGNIGLILMGLLIVTSLERPRVALFGPRYPFRSVHVVLSILLVVLVAAHMIGSNIYIAHPVKAAVCALIAAGLIVVTLKRPAPIVKPEPDVAPGSGAPP